MAHNNFWLALGFGGEPPSESSETVALPRWGESAQGRDYERCHCQRCSRKMTSLYGFCWADVIILQCMWRQCACEEIQIMTSYTNSAAKLGNFSQDF